MYICLYLIGAYVPKPLFSFLYVKVVVNSLVKIITDKNRRHVKEDDKITFRIKLVTIKRVHMYLCVIYAV